MMGRLEISRVVAERALVTATRKKEQSEGSPGRSMRSLLILRCRSARDMG
jgi:hypothetical protein